MPTFGRGSHHDMTPFHALATTGNAIQLVQVASVTATRFMALRWLAGFLVSAVSVLPAAGLEGPPNDLPRVPFVAAAEAMKTFQLRKGLRLELVASEPLIASPVGICFDEDGRLYVVEMRGYPDRREDDLGR